MLPSRHITVRILGVALVAALCLGAVPAVAAPATLADAQSQAGAARAKLDAMREKMAASTSAYQSTSRELAATRAQVSASKQKLKRVQASLRAGQETLGSQAQFLYRTDGTGFMDVLLNSASFEQFAARLSVLQIIAVKDAGLVLQLKRDRAEAQQLLGELQAREARQEKLAAKVAARRDSMQGSLDEQQAYYDSLSGQVRSLLDAQERAAKAANAGNGDVVNVSAPKKGAPKPSSGSVALKKVTVTGRGGSWWAMASDSDSFSPTGVKFTGKATLYSVAENGTGTSSGRPLNDNELTCAHRTLPFGTRVAVKHGGRQIIVVVTDRGPYTSGRVIDLTLRGARLLGVDGVGSVSCEVVEGN